MSLSIALSGLGMGGFLLPLMVGYTISRLGWRAAYTLLGLLVLSMILPVVGLIVREAPEKMGVGLESGGQKAGSYASTLALDMQGRG
jgi:hypothetical protein